MFRESLIETSRATKAHRGWATFVSFCVETAGIGVLVLVPLIYTDALPALRLGEAPVPPPAAPRMRDMVKAATELVPVPPELQDTVIRVPTQIPNTISMEKEPVRPPSLNSAEDCVGCVVGSTEITDERTKHNVVAELFKRPPVAAVFKGGATQTTLRISHMDPGMLVARVDPKYPVLAVKTRTQGQVVLAAVIGRDGQVENLHAVSGHPLLIEAALQAVRQWRYRPTMLNGQPVEVETQITVNFTLNQ